MVSMRLLFHVMIACTMIVLVAELRKGSDISSAVAIVTVAIAIAGTWRKEDE